MHWYEHLCIRFVANVDPHASIINFNAALASAKRKYTLDTEEIKGIFIDALDKVFYAGVVVNRLTLTDQRAAVDLNTIQLWTRQCYTSNVKAGVMGGLSAARLTVDAEEKSAIADLTSTILDLQRHVKNLSSRMDDTNNFTPRGAKPRGKMIRFAARDLPVGGNWTQSEQKKRVAFHKGTGEFVPFCANDTCALESARHHWHRDCPNGGKAANKKEFGSHNFNVSDFENDMYAEQFQCAVEKCDSKTIDALCFLVGGEPAMCDELSAYSFGVTASGAHSALGKYAAYCQPVDTSIGGFHVGGASDGVPSFAIVKIDGVHTFADIISRGPLAVHHEELHLQNAWMIDDRDDGNNELLNDSESSDEEDDTETVSDAPRSVVPRHAPLAGQALGGAPMDPFGDIPSDTGGDAIPAAIPPRKQTRYRQEKRKAFTAAAWSRYHRLFRILIRPCMIRFTSALHVIRRRGGGLNRRFQHREPLNFFHE
ncbi:hypothetical protein CYMTET_28541 [Cymbomonas tetramitiformis]|uniref:Uncharacterized protein n=1 Tax=Cymbomonas tetramitiformis TaxID=36881 RepID=A0AAE0FMQ4_9CHLO|nr:hypothetical protein CYMTET_28541 [Cymbomonas tetramitiformis]